MDIYTVPIYATINAAKRRILLKVGVKLGFFF